MMYEELVKSLRETRERIRQYPDVVMYVPPYQLSAAADAIEELLRAAKKMHLWIFLHSYDEQAAYNECGLSDEMNAALGYGGQFVTELPRDIKLKVMKRENELGIYDKLPLVDQREMPKEELKLDIAKRIIKEHYKEGDCGLFCTRNGVGDPMANIYDKDGLVIDICYYYQYFEVFGLSTAEFDELNKYYNQLIIKAEEDEE